MLADKDLKESKEIGFKKFKKYYNLGIEKKENFDNLNKLIEKSEFREENSLILNFLLDDYSKQKDDLLKYRILKLMNWFLYGKQNYDYYLKFKDYLFKLLYSKNGNVRHNSTHLINDLRGHLICFSDVSFKYFTNSEHKFSEEEKNYMKKSQDLLVSSFFELVEMYENCEDEKIKKNILNSIKHYFCYNMDEIVEGTSQKKVDVYNKYSELIFGKDEFEEVDEEEFENFFQVPKSKAGFVFDYESCNDINKLKEHIKELRDMIIGLMEESDDLDEYICELEKKVQNLGGEV